ncbi:hypothetical protein DV736_g5127, partial [Chaetothyriales sp. CBS 134916]
MFLTSTCAGRHSNACSGNGENWAAHYAAQGYGGLASDGLQVYNTNFQVVEPPLESITYPDHLYPSQSYPVEASQDVLDPEFDTADTRSDTPSFYLSDGTNDPSKAIDTTGMVVTRAYGSQTRMATLPYDYSLENVIPKASATDEPPAYSTQPVSPAQFHNLTELTEYTLVQPGYHNPGVIQGSATTQKLSCSYSYTSDSSQNAFHHSTQLPTPSVAAVQIPGTSVSQSNQNELIQPPVPNINTNCRHVPEKPVSDGRQTSPPTEELSSDAEVGLWFEALEHSHPQENHRFTQASGLPHRLAQTGNIEDTHSLQLGHESADADGTAFNKAAIDFDGPYAVCRQYALDLPDREIKV